MAPPEAAPGVSVYHECMAISPARRLSFDTLLAVEERSAFATELLRTPHPSVSDADRRLATEIVLGVLRRRGELDYLIARGARRALRQFDPPVVIALRIGLYQLRFLDRIPAMAAVDESVELTKRAGYRSAAGLVNALLRRAPQEPMAALVGAESETAAGREALFSHPAWLLERWERRFGREVAERIACYDNELPPTVVRWNAGDARALPGEAPGEPAGCVQGAYRVGGEARERRQAAGDRVHAAGGELDRPRRREAAAAGGTSAAAAPLWIQDEASQLIPLLLQPHAGDRILDACAAPGGKTAAIRALAPEALIVALERHPARAAQMAERLQGLGVAIVAGDAGALPLARPFDRILLDAPCTGTGTLARNPEIRWRLQPDDPARLQTLQLSLLRSCLELLKPGGRLVYSVCSLEAEEGEQVVTALAAENSAVTIAAVGETIAQLEGTGQLRNFDRRQLRGPFLQTIPGLHAWDGFFAAVIEKRQPTAPA